MSKLSLLVGSSLLAILCLTGCAQSGTQETLTTLRVGYLSNITHAQPMVGLADGTFQTALGEGVAIEAKTFNAGPAEIEALFAGDIDLGYIGPSPALNGYVQSQGESLRILAGSMNGGAALVLQPDLAAKFVSDGPSALAGSKLASPQLGNTQDISLKTYLSDHGLTDQVELVPLANGDQLPLFQQGELDGSWAPEPWATRLVQEAGGVLAVDENTLWPNGQFATTVLIGRTDFIEQHPAAVQAWVEAHAQITQWIIDYPNEAQAKVNAAITEISGKGLNDATLAEAWQRLTPTTQMPNDSVSTFAQRAQALELLDPAGVNLEAIYEPSFLETL